MPDKNSIFPDFFKDINLDEEQEEQDSLFPDWFADIDLDEEDEESDDGSLGLPSFEFNPATQDKTTFNRPVFSLERDGDKNNVYPFPSGDFYDIISGDDDKEETPKLVKDIQKKEGTFVPEPKVTTDFRLLTEEEEEKLYPQTVQEAEFGQHKVTLKGVEEGEDIVQELPTSQLRYDRTKIFKISEHTEGYENDREKLEAYLNLEYFTKSQHLKNIIGTDNLTAYQIKDPDLKRLKEDFKSNLGELGISRTAYPNLEDYHLDEILTDVFTAQVAKEKLDIAVGDQYTTINDILIKKEKDTSDADAIKEGVDRLDNGKINGRANKNEIEYARITKLLRGELDDDTRKKYEDRLNVNIPGSLGDILFMKDEVKMVGFNQYEKTGKRIPKDKKFELFHDPVSGINYKAGERKVAETKGGAVINITDAYQIYLNKFENTSLDDLTKFNHQLLLEEAGYKIEGKELGNYYVGDQVIRGMLIDKGYEMDKDGIFKDVPLGVLTELSNIPGTSDFWGRDVFMAKGEIIPQDYKNKPYETEEEFLDFLRVRRQQGHDIAAKNEAMFQTYYLNRDISSINKSRKGQFFGNFAGTLFGKRTTQEQFGFTNQDVVDVFASEILDPSGVDTTPGQQEVFERTVADRFTEGGGALLGMVTLLGGTVNPAMKALGVNKMIAGITAPRYLATRLTWNGTKAGGVIKQSKVIRDAASVGKSVSQYADDIGLKILPVTSTQKGVGLVAGALLEEWKMGPVLGAMTDDRVRFEPGVGAGFYLMPKLIPFGFGRFAQGKPLGMTFKNNQMNTFMQSTFVNGPSFALAVEGGDFLNALGDDMMGREEIYGWAKHHWGDRKENMIRVGLNIVNGKVLGMMHFNPLDYKTTSMIGDFKRESMGLYAKDYKKIKELAKKEKLTPEEFMLWNPKHKDVQNAQKHHTDWMLSDQRLDLINETADWTGDGANTKKVYEDHYKPLVELFENKGKKIQIEVGNKPIYQSMGFKNGREVFDEVDALYTRMSDSKDGIARIQINTRKSKGKATASHEGLHAYLDLLFDGNIKVEKAFMESLKTALKSMKTEGGSNVYQDILNTKDIKDINKLEELMAYGAEYLGKVENYNALVSNQGFTKMKKFWNNFAGSAFPGLKADLTLKQDIIDLLGTYGRTGDIRKLDKFAENIEYDPTGEARKGQVATRGESINKEIAEIKKEKKGVLKNLNDINITKPKGYKTVAEEKREEWKKLDARQKELENQVEIEDVKEEVKETGWDQQIDKNYTIGKYKDKTVNGKKITAKEDFQNKQRFAGDKAVAEDIRNSTGLENKIRQNATLMRVPKEAQKQFVQDVKERIIEKFLKEYDPGKINKEFGRELTPFGWMTHRTKHKPSMIYRAAGDVAAKYKKEIPTIKADAYEGGIEAFEGYSEQTGHMNTAKTFDSKVERDGIELSEQPGMKKKVGDKTLGEVIDQKSGADAKNLDFGAKGAKKIVSYKNIQPNAEKTIGKEVTVDYYKVTPEMYKKMQKRVDQQLNNDDITNVLKVIKDNIGIELGMIPRWKQSIIDKHTGQEVAFMIVGGKFPSEPKATGTTTKILKLGQEGGLKNGKIKGLLYNEIPQTGTKGSKYEYSKRYEEYLKTLDKAFKTEFEQDVIEALSKGDRADKSGKLKGWMIQRKKAMYVQGVDKALPNTPELTARHTLAEMSNQVKAGLNPGLAAKDVNAVIKMLQKDRIDIYDIYEAMPNSPKARAPIEKLILERDALSKDTDVIKANMKYQSELEVKTEAELDAVYLESVNRSRQIAKDNNLVENLADPNWIANNPNKVIGTKIVKGKKVEITAEQWRKDLDFQVLEEMGVDLKELEALQTKKGQTYHHALESILVELGFNSKSRRQKLPNGDFVYLNKGKKGSADAIYSFLGKTVSTKKGKSAKKYEKVYRPDWSTEKKNLQKLEDEMVANNEPIEAIKDAKIEMYRKNASYSGKSKDYEATEKANRDFFEDYFTAMAKVAYKNKNNNGIEYFLQSRAMQTNHAKGITKSLGYKMTSLPAIGSGPGKFKITNAKGKVVEKDNKGIGSHWEHALQLLNQTNRFVDLMRKHKGVTPAFKKGLKNILDVSDQHLIPKNGQLFNDAKGPTTFTKVYTEMLKMGIDNPLLNVFANKHVKLENNFIVSGLNKGKSLLDVQLESINIAIAKKILSKLSKSEWQLFEHQLNHKLKNKNAEIKNKKSLEKVVGKKAVKDLTSKDINKTIKVIDKAIAEGRKRKKKSRSMSTWDLDDTLIYSKSGVRYTLPNPSGKPAPGRKVIFLAGGAGSGKSNVVKKLGLQEQGFKIVNQDISLEWLMKNHGLPTSMSEFTAKQRSQFSKLSHEARQIALRKRMKFQGKGDGVIVDGTGASLKVMEKNIQEFKDKGYDVQMIFVETSKDISIARNKARPERSLKTKIVETTWESVQGNKEAYKKLFGERFAEVNTDNLKMGDAVPPELIRKLDAFTKGYIKARLNAGEFADKGAELKEQGAEFDFAEFDVIKQGEPGPFFQKALDRAKKYGTENQFILTARPPEAAPHIQEFLKSLGLNIPLENITGLGNSTAEAKAMWMLKKFSEGYNDMYFADDAVQNVKEVKHVLDQLDIKSKVVQVNKVKDVNKLDSPGTYEGILASKNLRSEYEKTIAKHRPDLVKEGLVSRTVDDMFDFIDTLNVPANKKKKYEQIITKWLATSNIKLKEDAYKLEQAVEIAEKYKEDIFSYRNPNELIEKYAGKIKKKPLNPNKTKEFTFSGEHKKRGITVYEVQNTKEGQQAVRDIIDTHWGKDSNPWCITQTSKLDTGFGEFKTRQKAESFAQKKRKEGAVVTIKKRKEPGKEGFYYEVNYENRSKEGKLTDDAWHNWTAYEKGPKRIIFHNGRLSSFYANRQYWDRMDNATDGPTITIKKGRVTNKVELVPDGTGRIEEFIRETRTVSKDKKTVTTEIFADSQDGYTEGTKIVENRVNGKTVKSTRYNPKGGIVEIKDFNKNGKATASYNFFPDGKMSAVNTYGQPFGDMTTNDVVRQKGDILSHQHAEGGIAYMYGRIKLNDKATEIGWKVAEKNSDLKNVIKTVDGKVRLDLKKVLEIDADARTTLPGKTPVKLSEALKPQVREGIQSLEPVKKVLDQLDVKSDVQQALASKNLNKAVNNIMEHSLGIESKKRFSTAEGKVRGKDKKRRAFFIPDSAADLELLIEPLLGKGKKGIENRKWFNENFHKPFERGINDLNTARQTILNDYMALRKQNKDIVKSLDKPVEGTNFTVDQAARVYIWNKAGFEAPGLTKTSKAKLLEHVANNPKLQAFADNVAKLTKIETGLKKPSEYWWGETLATEVSETGRTIGRDKYIADWIEAKNEIFSKENLAKMESELGPRWREAMDGMLYRMETGRMRAENLDRLSNEVMDYLNGATGAIMHLNTRSAALQLISTVNFINHGENNPFAAAKAFANLPQYTKDFMFIMNSPMLKQRRAGLQINVSEAELAAAASSGKKGGYQTAKRMLATILKHGYLPTKIADSFAIASGGATYYRNRIKMYEKQGLKTKEAERKAWIDFQAIAEKTQQSSRPDLLSQQQVSVAGRVILPFGNTPMQMNRIAMKEQLDVAKGRYDGYFGENSLTHKLSKISYYYAIQSAIFAGLQSAAFALWTMSDDEPLIAQKKSRAANTMADSFLRGMGISGAVAAGFKNAIIKFLEQNKKGFNADYSEVGEALLNISPTIGSKFSGMDATGNTFKYNKKEILEKGFSLDNTKGIEAAAQTIQAITNAPTYNYIKKNKNIQSALDKQNAAWQRIHNIWGYSAWDVGVEDKKKKKKKKKAFEILYDLD